MERTNTEEERDKMLERNPDLAAIAVQVAESVRKTRKRVDGDGSCLMYSLHANLVPNFDMQSKQRQQSDGLVLRLAAVDHMRNNKASVWPMVQITRGDEFDDFDVYLLEMSQRRTCADEHFFSAICDVLDCNIVMLDANFHIHDATLQTGLNADRHHCCFVIYSAAAKHYDAVTGVQGAMRGSHTPRRFQKLYTHGYAPCTMLPDDDPDSDSDGEGYPSNEEDDGRGGAKDGEPGCPGFPDGSFKILRRSTEDVWTPSNGNFVKVCGYVRPGGEPCTSRAHRRRNHCGQCHELTSDHHYDCPVWKAHAKEVARRTAPMPDNIPARMTAPLKRTSSANPRPCQFKGCGRVACGGVSNHCKECGCFVNSHAADCPVITQRDKDEDAAALPQGFDKDLPLTYLQFNLIRLRGHCPRSWLDEVVKATENLRKLGVCEHYMFVLERGANELHLHLQGVVGFRVTVDESGAYNHLRGHFARHLNLDVVRNKNGTCSGWKKANISFLIKNLWRQSPTNIISAAASVLDPGPLPIVTSLLRTYMHCFPKLQLCSCPDPN